MTDTGGETHGLALMSSAYMFTLASVFLPDLLTQTGIKLEIATGIGAAHMALLFLAVSLWKY